MAMTAMLPLFFKGVAVVLATIFLRFLYQGYVHRKAVRSLKAQGLVSWIQRTLVNTQVVAEVDEYTNKHSHCCLIRSSSDTCPSSPSLASRIPPILTFTPSILGS